ncbi:hypothetical protein LZZ85_00230 [Terrimonas sp. NA20]|uniref:Serine protease n=1 Tax=Terrimonas ginsenosidimutans TaxID=2908004 RepID=A0ABS9KK35_9BACT|nr:hypothetical protein [Terrimonas ginsenosidimutans]MCG2612676.1 hypothetical protein [Terrimonas ginsenosidimutans]
MNIFKISAIFGLTLSSLVCFSQLQTGRLDEQILKSIVVIKKGTATGTGFLVGKLGSANTGYGKLFLVTNKHMIGSYSLVDTLMIADSIQIFFYDSSNNNQILPIVLKLKPEGIPSHAIHLHPNPKVDVVAIDITYIVNQVPEIYKYCILSQMLLPLKEIPVETNTGWGSPVFAIGYPFGIRVNNTNTPVLKSGIIASALTGDLEIASSWKNRKGAILTAVQSGSFFLVDGLIVGGNSGGPIVTPAEKIERKLGDRTLAKYQPNYVLGIVSHGVSGSGISTIFSSDTIIELLY